MKQKRQVTDSESRRNVLSDTKCGSVWNKYGHSTLNYQLKKLRMI